MRNVALILFLSSAAFAEIPAGPGHDETARVCGKCHSVEMVDNLRQNKSGWEETIARMLDFGATITETETQTIATYLAANFGIPEKVNPNTASAGDIEAGLNFSGPEAAAVIKYRKTNPPFKTAADLAKVPGLDARKIEAKKNALVF